MSHFKTALLACLLPMSAVAAPETYAIDPVHSFPHFSLNHLGMATITGRFDRMSGKITLDRAAKTGALDVKVDTASVSTGDAKHEPGSWAAKNYGPRSRDEHLRTARLLQRGRVPRGDLQGHQVQLQRRQPRKHRGHAHVAGREQAGQAHA